MTRPTDAALAAIQAGLAVHRADMRPGECPGCGAARLDGLPPLLHEDDCPLHGVGDQSEPKRTRGAPNA